MLPDGERGGEMILLMPTNKGTAIVELDVIIRVLPLNEQLESPPDEHDAPVVVNYPGKVIFIWLNDDPDIEPISKFKLVVLNNYVDENE